jgi:hypothetical protein
MWHDGSAASAAGQLTWSDALTAGLVARRTSVRIANRKIPISIREAYRKN